MTWDSISPLIKQIGSRAGGRRQPRPNSFLARDSMDQRLAAMRAQAQQDYTQRLAASQAQMQQQAELEALRRQAEQYQVAQLAALQSQVQQTQQYPQQVQPVINQPDATKALNPSAIGVMPPTAPPPPPAGTIAAPGQVGTVGMLTLNPNGTALTAEMQAKLDEARRQSEAIRAMTGRTDNYGAISPEVQAQLDTIRGQAAQINAMYGPAAPVFMPPETKGATIGPDGSVILTGGGKPPGGTPIDTKPSANKPTGAGGIDYSAYRGMTAAQVYGVHANGLPVGWDWGAFARTNGVVDPRTVDAAGRPVGNYASFGPQYQWGAPVSSNPVTTPATSSAFGSTASFNPNPMNGMGPMGSFGKPEGGGPSIFHKPAGVGSTAGGEGGTSWGGIDYGSYTQPPNDNPFAKRPYTFGY